MTIFFRNESTHYHENSTPSSNGNGLRYRRVPWLITHVIVDGEFHLAD